MNNVAFVYYHPEKRDIKVILYPEGDDHLIKAKYIHTATLDTRAFLEYIGNATEKEAIESINNLKNSYKNGEEEIKTDKVNRPRKKKANPQVSKGLFETGDMSPF